MSFGAPALDVSALRRRQGYWGGRAVASDARGAESAVALASAALDCAARAVDRSGLGGGSLRANADFARNLASDSAVGLVGVDAMDANAAARAVTAADRAVTCCATAGGAARVAIKGGGLARLTNS